MTTSIDDRGTGARSSPQRRRSGLRSLYGAEVLSGAGDGIFWVALVATLADRPHFGLLLTVAVLARLGPRALLSVAAGSMIARTSLRRLLVWIDLIRATLMFAVAALAVDGLSTAVLLAAVLASYIVGVPTRPALTVALVRIADETRLASSNATISTLRQLMTFIGPLLGVAVVSWSTSAAFAVNGVSFMGSAVLIAMTRGLDRPPDRTVASDGDTTSPGGRGLISSFTDGIESVRRVDGLAGLFALAGAMYFVRGFEMVVHVLVVRDLLHTAPDTIGYLAGAIGLGALAGMPIASRAADSGGPLKPVLVAVGLTALPTAALAAMGDLALASGLLLLVGVGMVVFEVVSVVTIQRATAASDIGHVFGSLNSATNAGKLAGAITAPILAAIIGTEGALIVVAAGIVLVAALTASSVSAIGRRASAHRVALEPMTDVLRRLALFHDARSTTLERLATAIVPCDVKAGTVLIREGEEPDDLYVTVEGRFDVTIQDRLVNTIGPREWFGEIGLVHRVRRMATVSAAVDSVVWRIPGDVFLDVLEESGSAPTALVQGIADRLAMASAQ